MTAQLLPEMTRSAVISEDGVYRYRLTRTWEPRLDRMVWIMLNPSTADASVDDPTIRRCIGFAKREGYGSIEVLNLFALRATTPTELLTHPRPEGKHNGAHWHEVLCSVPPRDVIVAWGMWAKKLEDRGVFSWAWATHGYSGYRCLGKTKDGSPRHPGRLGADQPFEEWP